MTEIKWTLTPISEQMVIRRCPKCGKQRNFRPSGCFRVNAQKKLLDVWHIYKCVNCDDTWNVEILARIHCANLDPTLHNCFLRNDSETAKKYAYDYTLLARHKAVLAELDEIAIDGPDIETFPMEPEIQIKLTSEFALPIRLGAVLAQKLKISRSRIGKLLAEGIISGFEKKALTRKVPQDFSFKLNPAVILQARQEQIESDAREEKLAEKAKERKEEEEKQRILEDIKNNPWRRKR